MVQAMPGLESKAGEGSCVAAGCNFCVQKGAANDAYFSDPSNFAGLKVVKMASIDHQIAGLSGNPNIDVATGLPSRYCNGNDYPPKANPDGEKGDNLPARCCDAIELTREDLLKWANSQSDAERCKVTIVGAPIVKRPRGMMAKFEKRCVVNGLNALYHTLSTLPKDKRPFYDNAGSLHERFFEQKACNTQLGERDALQIDIEQLTGPLGLLAIVLSIGVINHFFFKRVQCSSPPGNQLGLGTPFLSTCLRTT
jgi:hypothetical protein